MTTNKTKRKYEKPTSRTIVLHHRTTLLAGSPGGLDDRDNYTPDDSNPFGG